MRIISSVFQIEPYAESFKSDRIAEWSEVFKDNETDFPVIQLSYFDGRWCRKKVSIHILE